MNEINKINTRNSNKLFKLFLLCFYITIQNVKVMNEIRAPNRMVCSENVKVMNVKYKSYKPKIKKL